ncbi:MAG: D-alanyl-D-alanine carboxypeptidase [Clostridia bacterium]|nr:D-alanyl-D-alanine carboxypeptidase [Clostridia bacterium]
MKKIIKLTAILFICILSQNFIVPQNNFAFASSNSSEIVMEVNTNRVLYDDNAQEKKYMASTTKILTAIIIIENCNLSDIVTVTSKTVGVEGSSIYLEAGENITVKDLLYGLMLRSGNDCAETLAVYCSGSIENFAKLMNDKANEIGAFNSNFVNPHGLHDDNHYTTAYDLGLITCYAIKNPIFKEIVSTKSVKISFSTRDYDRHIKNKNKLLFGFEGCTGVKTGYTKKAGRCLVSSCCRDGMEIVCVVLNCPPMFEKSKELLNNAYKDYKLYKLVESDNILDFINCNSLDEEIGIFIKNDIILPLTEDERENIEIQYDYPKEINFNVKNDQEIGSIKIYYKNNLIFIEKIYTIL